MLLTVGQSDDTTSVITVLNHEFSLFVYRSPYRKLLALPWWLLCACVLAHYIRNPVEAREIAMLMSGFSLAD